MLSRRLGSVGGDVALILGGVRGICAVDVVMASEATFITTAVELTARACSDGELGEAVVPPVSAAEAMVT